MKFSIIIGVLIFLTVCLALSVIFSINSAQELKNILWVSSFYGFVSFLATVMWRKP